ncbi:sensor histidine kinase [Fluviicola taffensis]|uniref:Signal transduction histidine kinase, LytS n=1 Tax=Fluviicola taffensis (strain DSM 16823 / NCIMB 13979 / RW262) TaxID=755732 RepID=F2IIQ5_FLUTR|nr:histidine kinase [Fluviicola taffensis]AEA46017.1 signal transduction histidine kinase, LytS [Fluviicola taffensis DSM 16823]
MKHWFWILLFITPFCNAQDNAEFPSFQFTPLSINEGLSNRIVYSISEDQRGSIWIGTADGLNRVDGNQIQSYFFSQRNPSSICNNAIKHFYQESNFMWIGTEAGVSIFDLKTGRFSKPDPQNKSTLHLEFNTTFIKTSKQFWILGQHHFYKLLSSQQVKQFAYEGSKKLGIPVNKRIDFAFHDLNQQIWGVSGSRIGHLNPNNLNFVATIAVGNDKNEGITNVVPSKNGLWIGTWGNGLFAYDSNLKKLTKLRLTAPIIHDIASYSDSKGNSFLLAGTNLGYAIVNTSTGQFKEFELDTEVRNVFVDSRNTLWFGTDQGVYFAEQAKTGIQTLQLSSLVNNSLSTHIDSKRLIGSISSTNTNYYTSLLYANGFLKFDKNWKFEAYIPSLVKDLSQTAFRDIRHIFEITDHYWICTDAGLVKCQKDFKILKIIQLPFTEKAIQGRTLFKELIPYKTNQFLVRGDKFIAIFNWKTQQFSYIAHTNSLNNTIPDDLIVGQCLIGNKLYVASENYLYFIDLHSKEIKKIIFPFSGKRISSFTSLNNSLWIGTQTGLIEYRLASSTFHAYFRSDGLSSDNILQLASNHKITLWIATAKGLTAFNVFTKACKIYQNKEGISDEYMEGALFFDEKNQCVFSAIDKISFLDPSKFKKSKNQQRVFITEITVGSKKVLWKEFHNLKSLVVPYSTNDLSIDFTIPAYLPDSKEQSYYYKVNNQWKKLNSSVLELSNLPIGKTFVTIASNPQESILNDQLLITIYPPWYKTWWFMGICILVFGLLIANMIRFRVNQSNRKFQEKELIQNQIRDAEMKTLRSQMNPHFMFNALNSINRFIIQNDSEQASNYLTTFSKLMRNILENSKKATISLKKEIDSLRLYLELEAARLEHNFDYFIAIDSDIDSEFIELPPLILQPFVENAIWHGINNLPTRGKIKIEVKKNGSECIQIDISDNGIGIEMSKKIKQNQTNHKSYGIETTIHRLYLQNAENSISIINLSDEAGLSKGTRISILIHH